MLTFFSKKQKFKSEPISFIFGLSTEEYIKNVEERRLIYSKNKNFWNIIEDIKYEISYFFRNFRSNLYSVVHGFENLSKYRKVIWNDRWYDYSFMTELLYIKLKDMRDNWPNSNYVNSEKEEEVLKTLVILLEKMKEDNDLESQKKFFRLLSTNYQKFWD